MGQAPQAQQVPIVTTQLFDTPKRTRYRGITAIVHVPRNVRRCRRCDLPALTELHVRQSALFWSHGHGATQQTSVLWCPACGYVVKVEVSEIAPDISERAVASHHG